MDRSINWCIGVIPFPRSFGYLRFCLWIQQGLAICAMARAWDGWKGEGWSQSIGLRSGTALRMAASHLSPLAIHWLRLDMSVFESCFLGGMCGSASFWRSLMRRLSSGFSKFMALPVSPPFRIPWRVESRSPPLRFSPSDNLVVSNVRFSLHDLSE